MVPICLSNLNIFIQMCTQMSSVCCQHMNKVNKFLLHGIISMLSTTLET